MIKSQEISITHPQQRQLSRIQKIITRLESNSFNLKIFAMVLVITFLMFIEVTKNTNLSLAHVLVVCLPLVVFWIMDVGYLWLSRAFRHLSKAIRIGELEPPFKIDMGPYIEKESFVRIAFSWSVFPFYLSMILFISMSSIAAT